MTAERVTGVVEAINVSDGGVPKRSVSRAMVTERGVEGDRQRDLRHHGGPDRALCLYSADLIDALRAEGHAITAGAAGENVTVRGIPWDAMVPGVKLRVGEVDAEVTAYAHPCDNLRPYFIDETFTRISQKLHPGWSRVYARVLSGGVIERGAAVTMDAG
jgi:MOSC domain-containing protein YiiM